MRGASVVFYLLMLLGGNESGGNESGGEGGQE